MKIYDPPVWAIMIIRRNNSHNADLFLSNQKTQNQRDTWPIYEAKSKILLQNFFLSVSNFFGPSIIFWLKVAFVFCVFLEKTGDLNLISVSYLAGKNAISWLSWKPVAVMKNDINNFFLFFRSLQKLLMTFFQKWHTLEAMGVHVRMSPDTLEWRPTVVWN